MKVRCMKCSSEMLFPFFECKECGWEPKGDFRRKSEKFALYHIKKNGNDPGLIRKLERARKGISEDDMVWNASSNKKGEPKVNCKECHGNMIFPFLECGSCGWIARRRLRTCSREFADRYIKVHPEKEEILRILWNEENRRLSKK